MYLPVRYFTNNNLETLTELQIENVGNDLKTYDYNTNGEAKG